MFRRPADGLASSSSSGPTGRGAFARAGRTGFLSSDPDPNIARSSGSSSARAFPLRASNDDYAPPIIGRDRVQNGLHGGVAGDRSVYRQPNRNYHHDSRDQWRPSIPPSRIPSNTSIPHHPSRHPGPLPLNGDPRRKADPDGTSASSRGSEGLSRPHKVSATLHRAEGSAESGNWASSQRSLSEPRNLHVSTRSSGRSSANSDTNVKVPPPEYLHLSRLSETSISSHSFHKKDHITPKLLILDLNGALVYRTKGNTRRAHGRPYLACFLEYVLLPEPSNPTQRPWELFVWSSAQPHNVRGMVESAFGLKWCEGIWKGEKEEQKVGRLRRGEGRLLGIWSRDKMGLTEAQYIPGVKTQTVKDLRKIIDHVASLENFPPEIVSKGFDLKTTVLLDDSPLKGVLQPWSQIVVPEYDKGMFRSSQLADIRRDRAADRGSSSTSSEPDGLDETLLGVIGILEELREVDNVPLWIRSGGLMDFSSPRPRVSTGNSDPEDLPSRPDFVHWYQRPEILKFWIQKGKLALERKGLRPVVGISTSPEDMFSPPPPSPHSRTMDRLSRATTEQSEEESLYSVRPYSPSRPAYEDSTSKRDSIEILRGAETTPATATKRSGHSISAGGVEPQPMLPRASSPDSGQRRTFRAVDVSSYLVDLADRVFFAEPQRAKILEVGMILNNLDLEDEPSSYPQQGPSQIRPRQNEGSSSGSDANRDLGERQNTAVIAFSDATARTEASEMRKEKWQGKERGDKGGSKGSALPPDQSFLCSPDTSGKSSKKLTKSQRKAARLVRLQAEMELSTSSAPTGPPINFTPGQRSASPVRGIKPVSSLVMKLRRKFHRDLSVIEQLQKDALAAEQALERDEPTLIAKGAKALRQRKGALKFLQDRISQLHRAQASRASQIQSLTGESVGQPDIENRQQSSRSPETSDQRTIGDKRERPEDELDILLQQIIGDGSTPELAAASSWNNPASSRIPQIDASSVIILAADESSRSAKRQRTNRPGKSRR